MLNSIKNFVKGLVEKGSIDQSKAGEVEAAMVDSVIIDKTEVTNMVTNQTKSIADELRAEFNGRIETLEAIKPAKVEPVNLVEIFNSAKEEEKTALLDGLGVTAMKEDFESLRNSIATIKATGVVPTNNGENPLGDDEEAPTPTVNAWQVKTLRAAVKGGSITKENFKKMTGVAYEA